MHKPKKLEEPSQIWTKFKTGLQQALAIVTADLQKLLHDPFELFTRMIQPAIWLLFFGQAMAKTSIMPEKSYVDFLAPGILAQSVLFVAIFYGIALIWDRDTGILQKILVSPTPRIILVIGRSISAGLRSLSQLLIIYFISYWLGVNLRLDPLALLGVIMMMILAGAVFSTLSLVIAAVVKKKERFMGMGQAITMPLFFASNALYPIALMPGWLQSISLYNPLTYQVDALRHLMILGEPSRLGLGTDFGVTFAFYLLFLAIATPIYPKILY